MAKKKSTPAPGWPQPDRSPAERLSTGYTILDAESQIIEQSKRIEFFLTEYTVELLALKMGRGEFVVPAYQRNDVWEHARKSKFVESLLMGLPIPFLFFWERPNSGVLEIVDGSQRLRTISQYVSGQLQIGKLKKLPALEGLRFDDLPKSRQLKILNRTIRGIVLNEHADEVARFDLFERINTGSKIANTAEIRRGALSGPFQDLVVELADLAEFAEMTPLPQAKVMARGREELVGRFFAYSDGLDDYNERPSEFIFAYIERMNEKFREQNDAVRSRSIRSYRKRFLTMLNFVRDTFPNGFRKTSRSTAIPRVRFEAISIGSWQALEASPNLLTAPPDVSGWIGTEFDAVVGADGANVRSKLLGRIDFVRSHLLGG